MKTNTFIYKCHGLFINVTFIKVTVIVNSLYGVVIFTSKDAMRAGRYLPDIEVLPYLDGTFDVSINNYRYLLLPHHPWTTYLFWFMDVDCKKRIRRTMVFLSPFSDLMISVIVA